MEADGEASEDEVQQIHLTLSHLAAVTSLLQAIKTGAKQVSQPLLATCVLPVGL